MEFVKSHHVEMTDVATWAAWEPAIRLVAFVGSVCALSLSERLIRCRSHRPWREYGPNAALLLSNTILIRLISATSLVELGLFAAGASVGLLNLVTLPVWLAFLGALVALDFTTYLQHRLFHWVPLFWRLHQVHHSDQHFDLTTGVRFHPGEILLSYAFKAAVILLIGAPGLAIVCYEILLSSSALFTHANVQLPRRLDRALRWAIVTPDMHRIHHSVDSTEHNRNFGFFLVCWDRGLGSYWQDPSMDHSTMEIGLSGYPHPTSLKALLSNPIASTRPNSPPDG
jgi:sterol desaturase/sphingolipid hydroxylase (fatty acid hydroxylase superfamily)